MFLGTHTPRLDDKGRLILPAKFRDDLKNGIVIVKAQERCLEIWPAAEFSAKAEALRSASVTQKPVRDYLRVLYAGASDQLPDAQGRVSLPQQLREYAGIERECVVNGMNDRVEVWAPEAWDAYLAEAESAFANLSGEVLPGLT